MINFQPEQAVLHQSQVAGTPRPHHHPDLAAVGLGNSISELRRAPTSPP